MSKGQEQAKYQKQYRLAHKEQEKERKRQWYAAYKDEIRERQLAHAEERKEWKRQYYAAHKEQQKQQSRQYFHTPKGKAANQRGQVSRRARLAKVLNTLTAEEWQAILEAHEFKCAYCGKSLLDMFNSATRDHIIPISKGGDNVKGNIVPACQSCNAKKSNKLFGRSSGKNIYSFYEVLCHGVV